MKFKNALSQIACLAALSLWLSTPAQASDVTIDKVTASQAEDGSWRFNVTLNHADTGWDHYTNRWIVTSLDGETQYGERVLFHPHVNEMPFTRSQSGIVIPNSEEKVLIQAFDNLSEEASGFYEFELAIP